MVDEVLVHISAPQTRQNDDLYRALADAYRDFEPQVVDHDGVLQEANDLIHTSAAQQETDGAPAGGHGQDAAEASLVSANGEFYGSFPSRISSFDQDDGGAEELENESIPTSSRVARLDRIHMRWKERTAPRTSFSKDQRRSRPSSRISTEADTAFIEDTQLGAQALQSQLRDSYSTTDEDTSDGEPETELAVLPSQNRPTVQASQRTAPSRFLTSSSIPKTKSDEPPRKAPAIHVSQTKIVGDAVKAGVPVQTKLASGHVAAKVHQAGVLRSSNVHKQPNSIPRSSCNRQKAIDNDRDEESDFSKLAFDAYPPPPKVSVERPSRLPSQITKHLAAIKDQSPKRFRTTTKHSTPKADERGYWLINCSTWSRKLQHDFWNSVCGHIQSGRLGWAVSLHRDTLSAKALGQVRLYCWAEVAEHMWLILWLCSNGQVVGSQTRWIDADGRVVFEVA